VVSPAVPHGSPPRRVNQSSNQSIQEGTPRFREAGQAAAERASSGRKLTPLAKCGGAVEFEVFAAVEAALLVDVIVD